MITNNRDTVCSSKVGCFPTLHDLYSTIPRETRIHMKNVGRYAHILYQTLCNQDRGLANTHLGVDFSKYSQEIFEMHDIGRHYIPLSLLNKLEKLTDDEILIIKNHTVNAVLAIESVYQKPYPEDVMVQLLAIAVYHHERYDGKGYPSGLAGEDIPLGARICAIADTYDGIMTWKPYKLKQTTKKEATEIITREAGKQFDPMLVELFRQCVALF